MSTTQELHNKLKQHADDLKSGKAFSNPKSLFNRFHAWYVSLHSGGRYVLWGVAFLSPIAFGIAPYSGLEIPNNYIVMATTGVMAVTCLSTMMSVSLHKGGMEEKLAKKLSDTLRLHPSLKDTITTISQYISHPDVTNDWWSAVINTLNQIIDAKPTNNATEVSVLQEMIEKDSQQDVLVSVEFDEREKEIEHNHQHKSQRETQ